MKITDIKATTITVPLEAALRHSNGTHWGRFVRTVVEVETDEGIVGLGEMGGGGAGAELAFAGLKSYLVGHDPFDLNRMRYAICNPTASLYNNRTQLHAALEFACLDIIGKKLGVPVYQLLGGRVRDRIGFASYLFFRYADRRSGRGEVRTIDQLLKHARALKAEHGFHAHKLKAGVFHPDYELECFRALAAEFPADTLRYDPNAALSVEEALRFGQAISDLRNDYFEDPTWGLAGMRRLREKLSIPLATNTIVIDFEQLATNVRDPAVDVILLDTTFWGGIRACVRAAQICDTFGLGIAVHSSGELGIQLATMLHLGAVLPNLVFTADAHYHHLADDIIVGGKMRYENGAIAVPEAPGLGVELDRDKLATYAELYRSLGGYAYDRDPGRPGWYPLLPNTSFADHLNDAVPDLGLG
ncbi:mandelate racemase [Mesorhizobium sp. M7A.F.Ca.CA.001.09.2.1]|uniref:glucarate dehydratase n=1 Tax=Mesorhizobium ciceri TaxID=39645 RepID=A0AB38T9X8_9HYPH|nr:MULTISPECIES: enolase C-terminal domain-like protein [Mesorhizobium]RUY58525.1 mandelate racemase [Mesorhizobium sp. M7A.F.Ca.CA.001.13.2.1]MDF3214106.1 enolase C-terminal domain-like protein [Mesorhizobium ciceri]RUY62664.1 mandelate racemase [Mesorhizobium sp. M7A.F.Ca.CA.001.05.1.1]RUY66705.1 mandelate racemase [Mesorhizobium sp. M7A.F.Ca.CA.001.13.1.1]RUY74330.1 mandelate racemase [Mesorhizobium sp. M7A.F.Ca.CA.001.09.2.1]